MAMGQVLAINISEVKGVPKKTTIEEGHFVEEHGLLGDAHAGKWKRQVSLLADESVEKKCVNLVQRVFVQAGLQKILQPGV